MVIPPSQVLHDFVCFRGQDIMDLHVHDAETEEVGTAAGQYDCVYIRKSEGRRRSWLSKFVGR